MSTNRAIGADNKLLWHLPNDLKNFKKLTIGKPIIMGSKTFKSIGRPLPERENFILSSKAPTLNSLLHCKFFSDQNSLINFLQHNYAEQEIMIIGGETVYKQFLNLSNTIYLTLVHANLPGSVFFPELNAKEWQEDIDFRQEFLKDHKHLYNYSYIKLKRIRLL